MAVPDTLRMAIEQGRSIFRSALEAPDLAERWEVVPQSGQGEAAWSPQRVAEHAVPLEVRFAALVCEACGYPGVTWEGSTSYATPAEAVVAFDAAIAISNGRLKYVTETDLPKKQGEDSRCAEEYMLINAIHMNDHAQQIRNGPGPQAAR